MYVCMYVWPTQEMSAVELKHNEFKSRWKKGRQERRGDWGFHEVMFVFCLPGRYSLVFIDEGHQLELFFWYKCRSDRVEYAQNFNMLLGRLGKPATYHFSE